MTLATFSGLTALGEVIPSERIGSIVQGANYSPLVAELVAWAVTLESGRGSSYTFPRWDATTTPAGTKVETNEFSHVSMGLSEATASPAYVGMTLPFSREAIHDASIMVPVAPVAEATRSLRDRIDSDVLALIATAAVTNTIGSDLDTFDETKFLAALHTFKTLDNPAEAQTVFIGSRKQIADLLATIATTSASMTPSLMKAQDFTGSPVLGSYCGTLLLESGNCPTAGAGKAGCFTLAGSGYSGLGLVVAEPIGAEVDVNPRRKVVEITLSARYAACVTNPNRILEVISRS